MIEKDVILYVRGDQSYPDNDPDSTELVSEGRMTIKDNGEIVLAYDETELSGLQGTTTRFFIRDDIVTLTRSGTVSTQMVFQKGIQHSTLYETPWGSLAMDIHTTALGHRIGEHGGVMEIRYTLSAEHQVLSKNQFKIRVREKMR